MGCFFACFSACNHRKHRHLVNASPSKHQRDGADGSMQLGEESTKLHVPEEPIKAPEELKEKLEEQSRCNVQKKVVTFDLDVKTYEALSAEEEVADGAVKKNNEEKKSEKKEELADESKTVASTLTSYLPNHRYQNCARGDEYEELDLNDSDLDANGNESGHGDDQDLVQAESSESLFSLSIDSRKQMPGAELGEKEVTSPMPKCGSSDVEHSAVISNGDARDRNLCVVDSLLNPVENIIKWKSVKTRRNLPLQHQDKENIKVEQDFSAAISPEPDFKLMTQESKVDAGKRKIVDLETAVDTSLSSWLATPVSNRSVGSVGNSPSGRRETLSISHDDRPILGALTVVELKELSASTPPRRAKSRSPNETPIVGTVGRYWIHTGRMVDSDSGSSGRGMPNTLSKNRADETEKRDTTPFKARLERAGAQV